MPAPGLFAAAAARGGAGVAARGGALTSGIGGRLKKAASDAILETVFQGKQPTPNLQQKNLFSSLMSSTSTSGLSKALLEQPKQSNFEKQDQSYNILVVLRSIDSVLKASLNIHTKMLNLQIAKDQFDRETAAERKQNSSSRSQPAGATGAAAAQNQQKQEKGFVDSLLSIPGELAAATAAAVVPTVAGVFSGIAGFFQGDKPKPKPQPKPKVSSNPVSEPIPGYATGGKVRGNADAISDNILARINEGEYIIKSSAVTKNENLLNQINNGGEFNVLKQREKEAKLGSKIIAEDLTKTLKQIFKDEKLNKDLFFSNVLKHITPLTSLLSAFIKNRKETAAPPVQDKPKTSEFGKFAADTLMSFMGGNQNNSLVDFIAKYESNSDPNVYRKGGRAIYGANLEDMTIDDMLKLEGSVYGKMQGQKQWILARAKELNIDTSKTKFTEAVQDRMGNQQIMMLDSVQKAKKDPTPENINSAMTDLSKIWRALPDPRTGMTYGDQYSKYNKAGVSVQEYRDQFMKFLESENKSPLQNFVGDVKAVGQFLQQNMINREKMANRTNQPVAAQPVVVATNGNAPQSPSFRNTGIAIPDINGPRLFEVTQFPQGGR